jgi:hypothetical protein
VITEFVFKTNPEPASAVQYQYTVTFGSQAEIAPVYSAWQDLIADPNLDPRFGTIFIMMPLGAIISGTFYGTAAEFRATGIPESLPHGDGQVVLKDWLGSLANDAQTEGLYLSNLPVAFYSKSLSFRREELAPADRIKDLFQWVSNQDKGTLLWFIIFDASGGAISEVATNATAFAHRDKILFYQSYAMGMPLTQTSKDFITNFHNQVLASFAPSAYGTYPGYVDPALPDAQQQYWGANLPVLEQIKKRWDPKDVFFNPQGVRPAE